MKNRLFVVPLLLLSPFAHAGFNFGDCSGSGTFEQQIIHYGGDYENTINVGEIPVGIQGLKVSLTSDKDVDIRLYGENEDKIVHWPYGILSKSKQATKLYRDVNVTYSGYNGVDGEKGHEFIEINATTPTTMTMKAFGYQSGYATVNYSWEGKEDCDSENNAAQGTGSFTQEILEQDTILVGTIPPHIENVEINLTSEKDLDIQLYGVDGTAIVSWKPKGLLSGAMQQSIEYHGMNITWSGYNGTAMQKGHEFIKISELTSEMLIMKVFGYEAGEAEVTYSWGKAVQTTLTGHIKDVSGTSLSNVRVFIGDDEAVTDEAGNYTLLTTQSLPLSITTELEGYMENSQQINITDSLSQDFTLVTVDKVEIFNAQEGKTIKTKGAKITFLPDSIIDENGAPYQGDVKVKASYNRVTSIQGKAAFPGDYIGQRDDGNTTLLRSYGFIDIKLEDNQSNPLNIASSKSVELTFPMDPSIEETPDTIPLWYYDTTKGIWVEDGIAYYDASTDSYIGGVTHFTTWNLDVAVQPAKLNVCVEDNQGNPIANALLKLEGAGYNTTKHMENNTFNFQSLPADMNLSVTAYHNIGKSETTQIRLLPSQTKELPCLVIHESNETTVQNIKGRIIDENGQVIQKNFHISIRDAETGNYIDSMEVTNGLINLSILPPENNKIDIEILLEGNYQGYSTHYSINPYSNTIDIGDIELFIYTIQGEILDIGNQPIIPSDSNWGAGISLYTGYNELTGQHLKTNSFNLTFIGKKDENITIKYRIQGTNFEKNITLEDSHSIDLGQIKTDLFKIKGKVIDQNNIGVASSIKMYNTENKNLSHTSTEEEGIMTSRYFHYPKDNTLILRFHTSSRIYVEKTYTLSKQALVNLGTIQLDVVNYTIKILYPDGSPMKNVNLIIDSAETPYKYKYYYDNDIHTNDNGEIAFHKFFRPTSNKIKISVQLKGGEYTQIINLDNDEIFVDAVIVKGTISLSDTNTLLGDLRIFNITDPLINTPYYHKSDDADINNGTFSYGPFLRPDNGEITLFSAEYTTLKTHDKGITISLKADNHITDGVNYKAQRSQIQLCIDNIEQYKKLDIRYNNPYPHTTHSTQRFNRNSNDGTMKPIIPKIWQGDENVTLYIFGYDEDNVEYTNTISFTPNTSHIDLSNQCISLAGAIPAGEISITQSDTPENQTLTVGLEGNYWDFYPYNMEYLVTQEETASFTALKNGVYAVILDNGYDENYNNNNETTLGGNLTITTSNNQELKLDFEKENTYSASRLHALSIEVYQGNINIVKEGRLFDGGDW